RVVADATRAEPDGLPNAERFVKHALVAIAVESRVAHLHAGEEPLLSHEQRAFAVAVDSAAFQHDAGAGVRTLGLDAAKAGDARDLAADARVALEVRILRPGVERPVHEGDGSVGFDHPRRPRVAE